MRHEFKRIRAICLLPGILLLAGCSFNSGQITYYSDKLNSANPAANASNECTDGLDAASAPGGIYVSITGAVAYPGVYIMPVGSRVYDVINAAGGVVNGEEISDLNLVYIIEDGMQIHIARKDEKANAVLSAETVAAGNGTDASESGEKNGVVNINTATKEGFMTLTGIGETRAEAIIAYREAHGKFYSIDEIMNVTGIKEGTYNRIKDRLTVK